MNQNLSLKSSKMHLSTNALLHCLFLCSRLTLTTHGKRLGKTKTITPVYDETFKDNTS